MRIGIDVGGTNTDAVLMDGHHVVAKIKTPTTSDVMTGISVALRAIIDHASIATDTIQAVMIGTTHFTNAVVERRSLQSTATVRLGLPATQAIPPMTDWPADLRESLGGFYRLAHGGYEFDGRPISPLDAAELRHIAGEIGEQGIRAIAISAVFSPVNDDMERRAGEIIAEVLPDATITRSAEIGRIGLLERENAAILNACLRELARTTVTAFRQAIAALDIHAPLYLTQNDGTLMSANFAEQYPVLTFASGPTNSMRGAALLSGRREAIVVDIGGTTSDVGALMHGFPREASVAVDVGGVRTNFRMPDVFSFGLGGGSFVQRSPLAIGPRSLGYRLTERGRVFGGETLTSTDIAVAAGYAEIGDREFVSDLDSAFVGEAVDLIHRMTEDGIDRMKTTAEEVPVIVVGGGSILISRPLAGVSEIVKPEHFEAANAVGAAIAQISGEVDRVFALEGMTRQQAIETATTEAAGRAVEAGADERTVEIIDIEDVPLAYLPGNAVRIRVKAVGDLRLA